MIARNKQSQSNGICRHFAIEVLESRQLFSAGWLSSSFGTDGVVSLKIGSNTNDATSGVATSSGQILVVGDAVSGKTQSGFITRLNSDGSTDTSFGTSGVTTFRFMNTNTVPTGVAINPTTGDAVVCGVIGSGLSGQAFIAEFDTSGNLVPSFGTNGVATFAPDNGSAEASGIYIISNGVIAVGGTSLSSSGIGTMFALFNADGTPFTMFGGTGMNVDEPSSPTDAFVGTSVVQDQSHYIVSGFDANLATGHLTFQVTAFNIDTSVAVNFGNNGVATASFGNNDEAALRAVVDPTTHDIFAAGATSNGAIALLPGLPAEGDKGHATFGDFAIADFTDTGTLNTAFNGTGMQTIPIPAGKLAGASSIVEQSDGKFVLAGAAETGNKTADTAFARVNANGSVDTTFGSDGTSAADEGGSAGAFFAISDDVEGDIAIYVGGHRKITSNSGSAVISELTSDSSPQTSNPGPTPMLAPTVSAKFPASALAGSKTAGFNAGVKVANTGNGVATGPATLSVYFSPTPTLDTLTAILAESVPLSLKLAPGKTQNVPIHLKTFPTGLSGAYYLATQITGGGTSTAATSVSTNTGTIAPAFFNLANLSAGAAPASVTPGKTKIKLADVIENAGNVTISGALAIQLALSLDAADDNPMVIDVPISVPLKLAAGKSKSIKASVILPSSTVAGSYHVVLTIDPANTFSETTLSDNTAIGQSVVTVT